MLKKIANLDPARFNRLCSRCALIFLFVTIGAKTALYYHRGLPQWADFPQYYMGGAIVVSGAWDSMYPIPNEGTSVNPGFFTDSTVRPGHLAVMQKYNVPEATVRYMQPPPAALLMVPLVLLPIDTSWQVWTVLLILATWSIGHQAAKVHWLISGQVAKMQGVLVLLICLSPQAHRWIRASNMSVFVGWMVGVAVVELVRRRDGLRGALALSAGGLSKYALAVLGPLYLAMRQWRTIAWSIGMVGGLVLVALLLMGTGPFKVFANEVAPLLARSSTLDGNQGMYAMLLRTNGLTQADPLPAASRIFFYTSEFGLLAVALATILLAPQRRWLHSVNIAAAAGMLVSWMLIFSPIFWEHYQPYLTPFWGWLAWEAMRGRVRCVAAIAGIAAGMAPLPLFFQQGCRFLHLAEIKLPEPINSFMLLGPMVIYGMAVWRLLIAAPAEARSPVAAAADPAT